MKAVRVMTDVHHFPYGDYLYDGQVGDIVEIPILYKKHKGIVIEQNINSKFQLRKCKFLGFTVKMKYVDFLQQFSNLNISEVSWVLKTILSFFSSRVKVQEQNIKLPQIQLNEDQNNLLVEFKEYPLETFLLWGITGSGKTETFFKMACEVLKKGKQVLLILPEIILNESISQRFANLFQCDAVIWNSKSRNKKTFMNIVTGNSKFIIGTRSSIFLPFYDLGLIIIDEEHDKIHKQSQRLIYNCRDMAVLLGKKYKIPVILASATPSIESYYEVLQGNYRLLKLTKRFSGSLPTIEIKRTLEMLPKSTLNTCQEILQQKQQIIFFLNRRGFANYVICSQCKCNITCEECSLNIVWHRKKNLYLCHRCNKSYDYNKCPHCFTFDSLNCFGYGVEKISMLLSDHFKNANIATLSSDFYSKKEDIYDFIEKMNNKKVDIIVGTQMITKGLDFSSVALVVVLNFNQSGFDFRLNENTFQTLLQISGRAGRRNNTSRVIIQTSQTRNTILDLFQNMQYEKFLREELKQRKDFDLPPYCKIISIIGENINRIESKINKLPVEILSNRENTLFIKISPRKYIAIASNIRNILRNTQGSYRVDIDPYDILY